MKVLVTEKISVEALNLLEDAGYGVDVALGLSTDDLVQVIPEYSGLIVRSATRVPREVIEAATRLKIIGRAGIGVDNIDVQAATEHGIIVCNAPTSNVVSAAEQTMAMILSVARHTPQANLSMHSGKWERSKFVGTELYDKTLAIFGLGRIGSLVAERAAAFGMKLIGYDPYCSPERAEHLGVTLYDTIDEVLPLADFVTIHLPKTRETIGMFGPEQYAAMKDGAYLINSARGSILNVDSLADFIAAGKIAGVAIDVYAKEPCTESPLHEFDNVILTPHLGAQTREAQKRAGTQIANYVLCGLEGRMVPTALNMAPTPPEVMEAVGPYIPACQMAGAVIAQLAREGISSLKVMVNGPLASYDVHVLATAALRAIFSESSDDPVNFVNADYIADQRDVEVVVDKDVASGEYANTIHLTARAGEQVIEISVTISGPHQVPRIVSILGHDLDLIPSENVIMLRYEDKPGKLGTIGTITGSHDINISTMQLSNSDADGTALVLMNVDKPVPQPVRDEIAEAVDLADAWYITLQTPGEPGAFGRRG
ncbi:MAG: phosphoglycerate dehydrogenase [Coriobacteriales bacterium]